MNDVLEDGRKISILIIIDDYNREVLAIEIGSSVPGQRVGRVLEKVFFDRGKAQSIRTDNSPEFTSNQMHLFCEKHEIEPWFIQSGKPSQKGYIERLNRTYREDVLGSYIFENIRHTNLSFIKIVTWNRLRTALMNGVKKTDFIGMGN